MADDLPVLVGHNAALRDGVAQVVFYPGAVFDAFKEWLASRDLTLTPPMVFTEDPLEVPTLFVVVTDEGLSKIGQSNGQ